MSHMEIRLHDFCLVLLWEGPNFIDASVYILDWEKQEVAVEGVNSGVRWPFEGGIIKELFEKVHQVAVSEELDIYIGSFRFTFLLAVVFLNAVVF